MPATGLEEMVVKLVNFISNGCRRVTQPAMKSCGPEYLRIIYGPEYLLPQNLERLRSRGVGAERSLAFREFALGIEALERFVRREQLRKTDECAFGVLALEGGATHADRLLRHPEQLLFFAPLIVLFGLISVQLRAGMITVGWSALGLGAFLFALAVSERSFRLSGLGLLLLALGKVLAVDVWNATPTDRYVTLIVLGVVLLLVSFLYSRYRETILELL